MKFVKFLIKIKDIFINALYPSDIKCILCGRDIPEPYICEYCLKENIFNEGNRCQICDSLIKDGNIICDFCKSHKHNFVSLCCPFLYDGLVRKAILQFKSDGASYLARPFAHFIAEALEIREIPFDVIIPVPSHKSTIKKRGYNPALLLANEIGKITGKPVENILYKTRKTQNQKFLDYKSRQNNLEDSLMLLNKSVIKNKNVLIVDDVITTGATIEACSKILINAKNIYGCAIARRNL